MTVGDARRRAEARYRRRAFAILAALLGISAACTNLDGLSSKKKSTAPKNLDQPPEGDGPPYTGQDDDTLKPVEVPVDPSRQQPVDAAGTWCASQDASFCADFDRGLELGWSARGGAHGQAELVDSGVSAPSAFAAVTEPTGDNVVPRAYLRKTFTDAPKEELAYSFLVKVDQIGATPTKGGTLATLVIGSSPGEYELQFSAWADGTAKMAERGPSIDGGARKYAEYDLPGFALGVWKKIAIRLDLRDPTTTTFTVAIDDTDALTTTPCLVALDKLAPDFYLGISYADPPAARWNVLYDNVVVSIR